MPEKAERLHRLPSYVFAVIGERIRDMQSRGMDVIRLDIGSPDLPPPQPVVDALAQSASRPDRHGYSGYRGTTDFRAAVAAHYQRRFGVSLDAEANVLPLIGSKEGIVNLCLAYLDQGDVAIVPDIGYPSYQQGARLAGADIYWLPVRDARQYLPDFSQVPADVRQRAKILWLNYPNNPTGAVADTDFYAEAVAFCRENDILLASDAPYVDVTFDGYTAPSVLQVPDAIDYAVEFMSFSKSYNMAGWRLGAAVGSAQALKTLLVVKSNMDSGHFHSIYDAGITALQTDPAWLAARNARYQARRDRIMAALPHIGLDAHCPTASLYIWAHPTGPLDAATYVERALDEAQVSLAPGGAYGPGGEHHIRISLGVPDARLDQALDRLKTWYAGAYD